MDTRIDKQDTPSEAVPAKRDWTAPKLTVLSISETRAGIFEAENEGAFIFFGAPGMGGCIIGDNCMGIS